MWSFHHRSWVHLCFLSHTKWQNELWQNCNKLSDSIPKATFLSKPLYHQGSHQLMHKCCRGGCYPRTGCKVSDILENLCIFKHVSHGKCHAGTNRLFTQQSRLSGSPTSGAPFQVKAKGDVENGRTTCRHWNACGPSTYFAFQKSWKATEGTCHLLPKGNVG